MSKAWWKSWTIWSGVIMIVLCFVPLVRKIFLQADHTLIQAQAAFHILLRFKTRGPVHHKELDVKEEGNGP